MPIYMDRHDVPETITAKDVAMMHQQDLKIQHLHHCRAITYWFDANSKTAFCLIDAPGPENIREMHNHAHGQIPHKVILVDPGVVETFLGRMEDPANDDNTGLNIITDPAFRVMMAVRLCTFEPENNVALANLMDDLSVRFFASVVKKDYDGFLLSFKSVINAINCAFELHKEKQLLPDKACCHGGTPNIGLSAGLPVTGAGAFFESTIQVAERLCHLAKDKILVSFELNEMLKDEYSGYNAIEQQVVSFAVKDEDFLIKLMNFIETEWHNQDLRVNDFNRPLGLSKSQLYRRMIALTGVSPATFLKEYRLRKALTLISQGQLNVSEVAFSAGFSSLSYFTKCFRKRFGCLPSACIAV